MTPDQFNINTVRSLAGSSFVSRRDSDAIYAVLAELKRLQESVAATMRWAKAATNAHDDLVAACCEFGARGRPMDVIHRDDWTRAMNWKKEIASAREAAEKAREE